MKKATMILSLCLGMSAFTAWAQPGPGGNFDPTEMRQRMMERYRDLLEVKSDAEWKVIQTGVEKVMTARREASMGGMGMMRMGGPGGGGPGGNGPGGGGPGGGGPGGGGAALSSEMTALQTALENNASTEELKTKLVAVRAARKAKQAKYEQAQEELKKLLTARQEAAAVMAGLLQ